ncbi:MAG TPA: alginate lyase family protein [Thermoanaerobaculia bacterium]|nr:alginate lyase family protein [Thermoanaerobaculia bacterium]
MRHTRGWQRLQRSVANFWTDVRVEALVAAPRCLVADDAKDALGMSAARGLIDRRSLLDRAEAIASKRFSILGAPLPQNAPWPWHTDWRFGRHWPTDDYSRYDFYEARTVPYDVKYPWELSRMAFLLPLVTGALLDGDETRVRQALDIIRDWSEQNPLAHSINWYPMEASARGIALLLVFQILMAAKAAPRDLKTLAILLTLHGEFVARNMELNEIGGNHYAANAVCIFLLGLALRDAYPPGRQWACDGARMIVQEIESQILPDGVDFEKSIGYHRLVTELFLLALMGASKSQVAIPDAAANRVRAATRFTNVYTRTDGWTPSLGDTDDGHLLQFDGLPARDHRPLAALGASFFHDAKPRGFFSASIPILLGWAAVEAYRELPEQTEDRVEHFQDGGIAIVRSAKHHLFVDVGEVGRRGHGGHGHNDLLSFELILDGVPIVVDPGSYLYTGDLQSRRWFQSTAAHNGVRLDRTEIAPILGTWSISDSAQPHDVSFTADSNYTVIRASHDGYMSLPDPALHTREIRFDAVSGVFSCTDLVRSIGEHDVERFLHFPPETTVVLGQRTAELTIQNRQFEISWTNAAASSVEDGWYSPSYGIRERALVIVLRERIRGPWSGTMTIASAKNRKIADDESGLVSAMVR